VCRSTPSIGGDIEAGVQQRFVSASTSATGETTSNSGSCYSFKTHSYDADEVESPLFPRRQMSKAASSHLLYDRDVCVLAVFALAAAAALV